MALYRFSMQVVGRQHKTISGRTNSAVGAAAYRSGEKLHDHKNDLSHNYSGREGVIDSFIVAPDDAPIWAANREDLWNAVEVAEKRKDAQLFRELQLGLQRELPIGQQAELVREFVQEHFVSKGMIADVAIHNDPENNNPHAHVMLTMRDILPDGFGLKNRDWNQFNPYKGQKAIEKTGRAAGGGDMVADLREAWAKVVNDALSESDVPNRVTHLSNEAAGLERQRENTSPAAQNMEQRGIETTLGEDKIFAQLANQVSTQQQAFEQEKAKVYPKQTASEFAVRLSNFWDRISDKASGFAQSIKEGFGKFLSRPQENNTGTKPPEPQAEI